MYHFLHNESHRIQGGCLMKRVSILILSPLMALTLAAQPQWKFHVAYEDATGARDTIFFIWDTSAVVYGIDTALGEGL